jgi:hypothetical protein
MNLPLSLGDISNELLDEYGLLGGDATALEPVVEITGQRASSTRTRYVACCAASGTSMTFLR